MDIISDFHNTIDTKLLFFHLRDEENDVQRE